MNNKEFIKKVVLIICLTIGVAFLFMPWQVKISVSYIAGAFLSILNVWRIGRKIEESLYQTESRARLSGLKGFYLRYLILIVCSVLLVKFAGINIVVYGLGLMSGQIAIIVVQASESAGCNDDQEK